jgi:histidine triad (HIT) family protein
MGASNLDCYACKKHRGEVNVPGGAVYQDDLIFIGHAWPESGEEAPYMGAFIVEPKRHVPGWAELSDEEAERVGIGIQRISSALKRQEGAEHIYVFVIGHHVPHLHVWVVPRYPDTPREHWGMALFEWEGRPRGRSEDVEAICERIRSVL